MKSDCISRFGLGFLIIISFIEDFQIDCYSLNSYESSNTTRFKRQTPKCNGFACLTNGQCITDEKRCDGTVDCSDESDEINCKDAVECPGYLFTCDYGACIETSKVCDGKKDCKDNSDEANCIKQVAQTIGGNCKSNQYQCKSGQCISLDELCDGKPDCKDRSDEIKEVCLNMDCPGYTYQCQYGACVDGNARCNGIKECFDNSDEEGCTTSPTPRPVTEIPPTPKPGNTKNCQLPDYPDHGDWKIFVGAETKEGIPGKPVASSTVLIYSCHNGFKLSLESNLRVCIGGEWSPAPECLKLCRKLITTENTRVHCYDKKGTEIKCSEVSDGETAQFECTHYFEPIDRLYQKRYCWKGNWNRPQPQCRPVCGEKSVSAEPLVIEGATVQKGNYPWTTALYKRDQATNTFQNISCGGSMLNQRVVLTAAHCVTDKNGNMLDVKLFKIGVGKFYNRYNDPRDSEAQYSDVQKIIIGEHYKGDSQRYADDIALLITKDKLLLSKVVQPVCFTNLPNINILSNDLGVVTGWGFTTAGGIPSEELKELTVPYKDEATCSRELPSEWKDRYLTHDKFCAGLYNQSKAVCKGDSGGGLVFKNPEDGRFYVHGIVSLSKTVKNVGCDIEVSALYTNVKTHYDWIEQRITQYDEL